VEQIENAQELADEYHLEHADHRRVKGLSVDMGRREIQFEHFVELLIFHSVLF